MENNDRRYSDCAQPIDIRPITGMRHLRFRKIQTMRTLMLGIESERCSTCRRTGRDASPDTNAAAEPKPSVYVVISGDIRRADQTRGIAVRTAPMAVSNGRAETTPTHASAIHPDGKAPIDRLRGNVARPHQKPLVGGMPILPVIACRFSSRPSLDPAAEWKQPALLPKPWR